MEPPSKVMCLDAEQNIIKSTRQPSISCPPDSALARKASQQQPVPPLRPCSSLQMPARTTTCSPPPILPRRFETMEPIPSSQPRFVRLRPMEQLRPVTPANPPAMKPALARGSSPPPLRFIPVPKPSLPKTSSVSGGTASDVARLEKKIDILTKLVIQMDGKLNNIRYRTPSPPFYPPTRLGESSNLLASMGENSSNISETMPLDALNASPGMQHGDSVEKSSNLGARLGEESRTTSESETQATTEEEPYIKPCTTVEELISLERRLAPGSDYFSQVAAMIDRRLPIAVDVEWKFKRALDILVDPVFFAQCSWIGLNNKYALRTHANLFSLFRCIGRIGSTKPSLRFVETFFKKRLWNAAIRIKSKKYQVLLGLADSEVENKKQRR